MRLSPKTIDKFQQLNCNLDGISRQQLRNRFELIDKYIAREGDSTSESVSLNRLTKGGRKSLLRNIEVPICYTKLDTEHAYQTSVFLTGFPIFGAVSDKKKADVAGQMQALMSRDQQRFNWVSNLSLILMDGLKYNLCAAETEWYQKLITQSGAKGEAAKQLVKYEGNRIKRIDPYNLIWDQSTKPNMCSEEGSHVGYIERKNYVSTKAYIQGLSDEHKILKNLSLALKAEPKELIYYEPSIRVDDTTANGPDWSTFWGFPSSKGNSNASGTYELLVLYVRIIPADFDIIAPRSGSPDIYKLVYVNGVIIYSERLETDMFPITICQPVAAGLGLEDKGFSENLQDTQDVASSLQIGRLKSLRRSVSDRALYDPTRINKADLLKDGPEAKIPVKLNQTQKDLQSAYYRIPYEDTMVQSYTQEFGMINAFADDISGLNRASQGNFVKGNKTLFEFDSVMQNSQARSQKRSIEFENTLFFPIKEMIKENYIKYAVSQMLFDQKAKGEVQINPVELAAASVEFKISDGLLPSSKLISSDTFNMAVQGFQTIPGLAQQYDAAGMFVHMLKSLGLGDLDDFKLQQQAQQSSGAAQPVGTNIQPTGGTGQ